MRLDSSRDPGAATVRSGRRKLRPGEPTDWNQRSDDAAPQPHPRGTVQIQRRIDAAAAPAPPQLTMRRREHNNPKAMDTTASAPVPATSAAAVAAAVASGGRSKRPPWQPGLTRTASDAYRRPSGTLMDSYDGEDESANEQQDPRRMRRNSSPPNYPRRRLMPGAYSEPSTHRSASVSSYGGDEEEDDHGFEVEEVGSSRHSRQRLSSQDEYFDSSSDRNRRYRKRFTRRYYSDNDNDSDGPLSGSEAPSTSHTRESSRVRSRSESRHKAQRYQLTHVIEGSRPPVASRKRRATSAGRATSKGRDGGGYRSAESAYEDRDPRRSFTMRSARSLNGSTSGPARILGNIFSNAASRPSSPDKFFKVEKDVKREKKKGIECVICREDTPSSQGADLKCGHRMCNACMKRSFEMSIHDPQHMPPRCCTNTHIPLKHVDKLFDNAFKMAWNRKFAEYSTGNRVYCPSKRCGEWIKPTSFYRGEDGRRVARCSRCKTKVCPRCSSKWHSSTECPRDEGTNKFLDQAKEDGWKKCYKCKSMVELKEGCNHMTCRCGAEFCMICGTKWKGCSCPWFNYENGNNPWENNPIRDLNIPTEDLRNILRKSRPNSMEELRSYARPTSSMPAAARPRAQEYDEETILRQLQEKRDAAFSRRLQVSDDYDPDHEDASDPGHDHDHDDDHDHHERDRDRDRDRKQDRDRDRDRNRKRERNRERERERENPFAPISPDIEEDELDYGLAGGKHHPMEDYRRTSMPTLPTAGLAAQQQPYSSYVSEVSRARGPQRSGSMEQRLADRLSENRSGRRSRGPSPPPAPAMRPHVLHTRDATLGHTTDMGIGMALGAMGRGSMPPPPVYGPGPPMPSPGLMRPNPFGGDAYYENAYTTAPRSVHEPYYYGGMEPAETERPSPRRRSRRSGEERERPKSSTLAGLTGYGRGAHRVSEWRNFVEPGVPDE
ncbi:hypothetical protein MKX07_008419 [Trichoderma sp. CBMAI-0711]|nr:hypothetical protein MKX07_008419 [Trichoderma sp. CBMAI-0711]